MDEQNARQTNAAVRRVAEFGVLELSALERRMQCLTGPTSTIQRRLARIDWRHNRARDSVLWRIWVAEK